MDTDKINFFLKLNPNRASFMLDMNEEEKVIMQKHFAYWANYVEDGTVIVLGPVMEPKGGFGIAIVQVDSKEQLNKILEQDPANAIGTYEVYPMRAVRKIF